MAGSGSSLIDLLSVQAGLETTWGTAVTPTVKLMGIEDIKLKPGVKATRFKDRRGALGPTYLAALAEIMPAGTMDALMLYEDPYILESLCGVAVPSGGGPYIRAYAAPLTAVPSPRIQTIVYGDATNCFKLSGALVSKAEFSGKTGEPCRAKCDIIGKQVTPDSLAVLGDRTVNVAMGNHVAIYIDAWGGTIGSTLIEQTAFEYALTVDSKRALDPFFGSLTADEYHEGEWDGELTLSMELNATVAAQLSALISGSALYQKQVRIKHTSSTNVIQLDFAGVAEETTDLFEERDGVVIFRIVLKKMYNNSLANWFKASVTNSVAVLA